MLSFVESDSFAAQFEATVSCLDEIVRARIDAKTKVKGIEFEGNLGVQACVNARPSVNMSAAMRRSYTGNIVHVDVSAGVGLDVASTGSMGSCFELCQLNVLIPCSAVTSSFRFSLTSQP